MNIPPLIPWLRIALWSGKKVILNDRLENLYLFHLLFSANTHCFTTYLLTFLPLTYGGFVVSTLEENIEAGREGYAGERRDCCPRERQTNVGVIFTWPRIGLGVNSSCSGIPGIKRHWDTKTIQTKNPIVRDKH